MSDAILLDVDGVLSPWPTRGSEFWGDWEPGPKTGFHLYLSRAMAERLASLPVEIVWLTTWERRANDDIGAWFGWEPRSVIDRAGHDSWHGEHWWKLNAAKAWVEANPGRRFVWIDDDHDQWPEAAECGREPRRGRVRDPARS